MRWQPPLGICRLCGVCRTLLNLFGHESGGFHLYGDSSGGKTTHLQVPASVYVGPRLVRSWRSTDNVLESIAAAHSDGLLVLDEIGMCDPRIIGETVYMLGNGTGKARANDRPTGAGVALAVSLDRREDVGAAHGGCKQGAESRHGGAHARRARGCEQRPRHVRCAE